jgi:HK97 family phage portal protein
LIFGKVKTFVKTGTWKEVGAYQATFTAFGNDLYANELVRSCIRALAEHTSKANARCIRREGENRIIGDKKLERMIQYRPNMYMNGKDFLYKVRTRYEIDNTAFIFIDRDDKGKCVGLYPMPKANYSAIDSNDELYIEFSFENGNKTTIPWDDLAVLRKDYNKSDIFGDPNDPILATLELMNTTNEGLGNAIKSTSNLRGILKSTKAMIDPAESKKQRDLFVADYMNIANEGGIASLDATQSFETIDMKPMTANYKHIEEFRNNIFRYFGVNDDVLMGKVKGDDWEAFYEYKIEGFLLALSLELTYKIFTKTEQGFGNEIIFESNRMAYMGFSNKLALVAMVDRGAMTPNQWNAVFNMAPVEGGDKPIRRLDTAVVVTEGGGKDEGKGKGIQGDSESVSDSE